ncbi:MAG: efflux RND transporter permease subunit [Thermoguttaceae bacterium]
MRRQFFARYSLLILMAVAFLMPLMYMGARRSLRTNKNDVKAWLPTNCQETTTYQWYRERFESDMFVLVSWEGGQRGGRRWEASTLDSDRLTMLAKKLVPPEDPAEDPATAPIRFFKNARTGRQIYDDLVAELMDDRDSGFSEEEARQLALARLKGFVIGNDGRQTCLLLTVCQESESQWELVRLGKRKPAEDQRSLRKLKFLQAAVEWVYAKAKECDIPREAIRLGGPPVDNAAIDREGERSLYRLAGVCAVVGLALSWWCLRSVSLTAMVFTSALFTAGLSLLVVFVVGDTMNAILMSMPSLVYVASTSAAIHLANYYRDTVRQHGFDGAPDRTVRAAWLPLALATGTTAIGLASMCVTNLIPIRMFGLYSAIGVMIGLAVVCLYMPSLLHYFPLRRIAEPVRGRLIDPGLSPKWRYVGQFIIRRAGWVTAACLALMAIGAYGVSQTKSSIKLMRLFSRDAQIIKDYAWLEHNLGALVPMEVVIRIDNQKSDLHWVDQLKLVAEVQAAVATLPDVGSTLAAPTFMRPLPEAGVFKRAAWAKRLQDSRPRLREFWYSENGEELWRVSARVAALTDLDYGVFVDDIRDKVEPVLDRYRAEGYEGIEAVYTGLVPLIYQAQSTMLDGLTLNFIGDLTLVAIAIIFLLRNLSAGLLLALPSLFPLAIIFGFMGWTGIVIDVGTVMVPAVALGVTVDDAIHFMLWCRHGQERGMSKQQAIMFAYQDCARAIYQSWAVIGLGLSAFALSSFTPTQRFGYLMFSMLTASSIGNLVLLPALLASPLGKYFWLSEEALKRRRSKAPPPHEPPVQPAEELEKAVIPMRPVAAARLHTRADQPHRRVVRK